jgi:hypothetical protein
MGVMGGSWWLAGSGTVLWRGSIWEVTNTGCSFHRAYQHILRRTHVKKPCDRKGQEQITELGCLAFEHKTKDFFLFLAKHDEIKILTS